MCPIKNLVLLRVELGFVEAAVKRAGEQQIIVLAHTHNAAVLHHHDLVRLHDGGQPVSNGNDGAALHHGIKGLLHVFLGLGIQLGGGLIQNEDGRVF